MLEVLHLHDAILVGLVAEIACVNDERVHLRCLDMDTLIILIPYSLLRHLVKHLYLLDLALPPLLTRYSYQLLSDIVRHWKIAEST